MNITQGNECSFCGKVETLEHLVYGYIKAESSWLDIQTQITTLGFDNYMLDAKTIILGELRSEYKLLNLIISATKILIYSNRDKTNRLIICQVKLLRSDLFHIEKHWAETNDKLPNLLGFCHYILSLSTHEPFVNEVYPVIEFCINCCFRSTFVIIKKHLKV